MKAEIISVGTELLLGEVTDTNAAYLAAQLPLLGASLRWITVVDDSMERLVEAFDRAWKRSDLILATGGLGPTQDDLTREAIARMLNEAMEVSEPLVQNLRVTFAAMGRQMAAANLKQACLIPSSQAIPNPRGTAPGWWVEKEGRILVAMPGPPGEMQRMWAREVMPRLQGKGQREVVLRRTLKCFGLSEAEVGEKASILFNSDNARLGIYAKPDGIHLRLIARAVSHEDAMAIIDQAEAKLRGVLSEHIWGTDEDTLEGIVGSLLAHRGLTVATMESCTGGLLGAIITDVPGSSAYYRGGFIAYSNETKTALGVEAQLIERHGAVSREVAQAMAEAARQRLEADIGIGITGVAGPDKLEDKTPGLVYMAVSDKQGTESWEARYPPGRPEVRRRASTHALFLLRQRLLKSNPKL